MKIAILGTRGIPNHYGGFEQFAEYLSVGLVKKGHNVTVFNSHNHPFQEKMWNEVKIIHSYNPESIIGTIGQFCYDFISIIKTRYKKYDIILQLGYSSSSIFLNFHTKEPIIITNVDGFEWKRDKYSKLTQKFLLFAESLAVKKSDFLIADSKVIQSYFIDKYEVKPQHISYGTTIPNTPDEKFLSNYDLKKEGYNMLIARLEPENCIETILEGAINCNNLMPFLVIGNFNTKFGKYLKTKFNNSPIQFLGPIYNIDELNSLRYFSNIYFHGHTVGGTNPSLLEAMASHSLICANDNEFNHSILGEDALYFENSSDIKKIIDNTTKNQYEAYLKNNAIKTKSMFNWQTIVNQYENYFYKCLKNRNNYV